MIDSIGCPCLVLRAISKRSRRVVGQPRVRGASSPQPESSREKHRSPSVPPEVGHVLPARDTPPADLMLVHSRSYVAVVARRADCVPLISASLFALPWRDVRFYPLSGIGGLIDGTWNVRIVASPVGSRYEPLQARSQVHRRCRGVGASENFESRDSTIALLQISILRPGPVVGR